MSIFRDPTRKASGQIDLGTIEDIEHNKSTGARKVMIVEPVIKRAVLATDHYDFGSYVKVTGTSYTLDCLGRAYDPLKTYNIGDIVTNGGFVYQANENNVTGAFDATKWKKVADKVIGPIPVSAGAVVSTGKWHNTVSAAGFLIDDDSIFTK